MSDRDVHIEHPATLGESLCGYTLGEGSRTAQAGDVVTCEACRAVVGFCRDTARLGALDQSSNPSLSEVRYRHQAAAM